MEYKPHKYQNLIISHILKNRRCAIWAGMGLGKTSSTLSALEMLFLAGENPPALVIAPLRVANYVWTNEATKWSHLKNLKVVPLTGTLQERLGALRKKADIYTINYEQLPWLIDELGTKWPFKIVIADEATRLKSFRLRQGGIRARALARVAHTKIKRFIQLTGTPAPNGLIDLWGQIWMLDRGERLGNTMKAYKERWFRPTYDGFGVEPLPHAQDQIQTRLRDICLTINAEDYFDLEKPIVSNIDVDLPVKALAQYEELESQLVLEIENHTITAANAAVKTLKLLQIANGAVYSDPSVDDDGNPKAKEWKVLHDAKLDALESIIEETGSPLLIAYNFKSDLIRVLKRFKKAEVLEGQDSIDRWNAGKIPMLLAHPASAGHGLSLQDGGNVIVFFSQDWNLENRLQIIERIGTVRQKQAGHNRSVFIYNILANNTVDKAVLERVDSKKSVQETLLNSLTKK